MKTLSNTGYPFFYLNDLTAMLHFMLQKVVNYPFQSDFIYREFPDPPRILIADGVKSLQKMLSYKSQSLEMPVQIFSLHHGQLFFPITNLRRKHDF